MVETLKLIEQNHKLIKKLTALGVIDSRWLRDYNIVQDYKQLEKEMRCVMCRYSILAERNGISEDSVRRIIREFKE
jgi:cytochrome c-type biogenesis protein CcmH/NrfF